jgi:hypothetical protein
LPLPLKFHLPLGFRLLADWELGEINLDDANLDLLDRIH